MRILPLLLATAALSAATTAEVPPNPTFEVKPGQLQMSRYRHWQSDGRTNDHREFSATLRFFTKGDVNVVSWSNLVVSEALSDTGEALSLNRQNQRDGGRIDPDQRRQRDGDAPDFEVQMSFAWPRKGGNGLAKLNGTVVVQIASGPAKKAELKPFKDMIGKSLEIVGIAGGEIAVDRSDRGNGGVTLRYSSAMQEKILGISFQDGSGRDISGGGRSSNSNGDEIENSYHLRLPDDGAIIIAIMPETRTQTVPFAVSGLLFDSDTGAPRERVKIEAKADVPGTKPADPNTLPVKPVEDTSKF